MAISIPRHHAVPVQLHRPGANGLGQLALQVRERLWQLHSQNEIGIIANIDPDDPDNTSLRGQWDADAEGPDLRVNRAYINSLPENQRLGAVSLELVHEAVHSVSNWRYLNEEVLARRLQILYYRELTRQGVLDETTDPRHRVDGRSSFGSIRTPSRAFDGRATGSTRISCWTTPSPARATTATRSTPGWIEENITRWGGLHNRWATTKGYFVRTLARRRRSGVHRPDPGHYGEHRYPGWLGRDAARRRPAADIADRPRSDELLPAPDRSPAASLGHAAGRVMSASGADHANFVSPGHGHRRHRQRDVPVVARRRQVFLRVHRHVPGDRLAGVGGHAAHDRQQRALGHVLAVVDRLAAADAGEQLVVLGLVDVVVRAVVGPVRSPSDDRRPPWRSMSSARPLRAERRGRSCRSCSRACCRQLLKSLAPLAYS